jgi:hypothetical protein
MNWPASVAMAASNPRTQATAMTPPTPTSRCRPADATVVRLS